MSLLEVEVDNNGKYRIRARVEESCMGARTGRELMLLLRQETEETEVMRSRDLETPKGRHGSFGAAFSARQASNDPFEPFHREQVQPLRGQALATSCRLSYCGRLGLNAGPTR